MDEIINYLNQSIEDNILSRSEKRELKSLIGNQLLTDDQLTFLQSRIYSIAAEKATTDNYPIIIEWIKSASSALKASPKQETASAYFSPGDACRSVITNQITQAVNSMRLCVFTISDDHITDSIITAHKKGVDVRIITDNDKSEDEGSDIEQLAREGIHVKMDETPHHMHHKFMVVDDKNLITGSYNWTRSAAKYNHENILLTTEPGVVKSFLNEFQQLWSKMKTI